MGDKGAFGGSRSVTMLYDVCLDSLLEASGKVPNSNGDWSCTSGNAPPLNALDLDSGVFYGRERRTKVPELRQAACFGYT